MGFFGLEIPTSKLTSPKGVSIELLHRVQCNACPLNHCHNRNPKLKPMGSGTLIYMLGGFPTKVSDDRGKTWAGSDFAFVRTKMPALVRDKLRWNNVIRDYPGDREPHFVEIECCRPSIVADIERHQPVAIFGFGGIPLKWAANETHAYQWQGRRIPVQIGNHVCWYYPFITPQDAIKGRRWEGHIADDEFTFEMHIRNAVREVLADKYDPIIHTEADARANVDIVTGENGKADLRKIERWLEKCKRSKYVGLDYETSQLRPYNKSAKICTGSLSIKEGTLAFPFRHRQAVWTKSQLFDLELMFADFLMTPGPVKIAHQLAFEMEWSAVKFGEEVLRAGSWGDTISQAYVIDETQGLLALEALTTQHFGINIKNLSNVDRKNIDGTELLAVLTYNGIDSKYHRLLYLRQAPILRDLDMVDVYNHQLRRIPTLVLTQMQGIPIDQEELAPFKDKYEDEIAAVEEKIEADPDVKRYYQRHHVEFKPSSSHDVVKMLKVIGHPSAKTDEKILKTIKVPIVKLILKHRKASKMLSTYVTPISKGSEHMFDDGCIRPIISTYKVRTWRTSSEDPNVQNWPHRGPGVVIRKTVKRVGYKIVAFDYAGIQARNIAMESCDPTLMKSFFDGYDIHQDWVENLAKRYPKWCYDDLRAKDGKSMKSARSGVKNQFVFPTCFGASPRTIAVSLAGSGKCSPPVEIVEGMQEEFFDRFPKIKEWQLRTQASYKRNGYVTGLSGHRRHAPIGYNEIINSPIQADESLIVLTAMSELSELDHARYQPMMEIHDDLTYLMEPSKIDAYSDVIISEMVWPRFDWINVPIVVEMSVGDNWCDLKAVGSFENVGNKGKYRELKK